MSTFISMSPRQYARSSANGSSSPVKARYHTSGNSANVPRKRSRRASLVFSKPIPRRTFASLIAGGWGHARTHTTIPGVNARKQRW